jgi:hypothetical protein
MLIYFPFKAIWVGVMHHIVNEHAWIVGHGDPDYNHCLHEPLEGEDRDKSWLHPVHDASALKDLAKIVFDKRLFNLIDKYLNFRYALFEKKKLILKNKYLR